VKVIDAGVIVELLAGGLDPARLGGEDLAVPHLVDSEVTNVLRGLVRREVLTEKQAAAALSGFAAFTLTRFPAEPLRARMWELRRNLSAYDATYVALAEAIGASALLTTDARLARAPGVRATIELL
jgi:predicted nucleic acid-binding protein